MRKLLRQVLTWVLASVIGVIAVSVFAEFFIEVARDKGLYEHAGQKWDSMMSAVSGFLTSHSVLYPTIALAGFVAGVCGCPAFFSGVRYWL